MSTFEVTVATIGRAHGLRGEVGLILHTDQPRTRLQPGTVLAVDGGGGPTSLTVARTRIQQERWYAAFEEIGDRSAAESLRGAELSLEVDAQDEAEEDPDAWYPSQLKGLTVLHVDGHELGVVAGIDHYPVQDLLIVRTRDRRSVQLPLVEQLVPEVDLEAGVVRADPPGGLFEDLPEEGPADDPEQD